MMRKIKVNAFICIPESKLTQSISFEMDYEENHTILELRYHLLAHTRSKLPPIALQYYKKPEDLGDIFDRSNPEVVYHPDLTITYCIANNNGPKIFQSSFYKFLAGNASSLPLLYLENKPTFLLQAVEQKCDSSVSKKRKAEENSTSNSSNSNSDKKLKKQKVSDSKEISNEANTSVIPADEESTGQDSLPTDVLEASSEENSVSLSN